MYTLTQAHISNSDGFNVSKTRAGREWLLPMSFCLAASAVGGCAGAETGMPTVMPTRTPLTAAEVLQRASSAVDGMNSFHFTMAGGERGNPPSGWH